MVKNSEPHSERLNFVLRIKLKLGLEILYWWNIFVK